MEASIEGILAQVCYLSRLLWVALDHVWVLIPNNVPRTLYRSGNGHLAYVLGLISL
jgi:hypothetical protein